jgi:hypothetical protein
MKQTTNKYTKLKNKNKITHCLSASSFTYRKTGIQVTVLLATTVKDKVTACKQLFVKYSWPSC